MLVILTMYWRVVPTGMYYYFTMPLTDTGKKFVFNLFYYYSTLNYLRCLLEHGVMVAAP